MSFPCLTTLSYVLKRGSRQLADVILLVKSENVSFPTHGLVLEARSPRFQQLLFVARGQHRHAAECFLTRCKYILELDHPFPVKVSAFSTFLELLYDGRVGRIQPHDASSVSALCEFYQVALASSIVVEEPSITTFAAKQTKAKDENNNGITSSSRVAVSAGRFAHSSKEEELTLGAGFGRNDLFGRDVEYAKKIRTIRSEVPDSSLECIESGADNDDFYYGPDRCANELSVDNNSSRVFDNNSPAPVTDSSSKEIGFVESAKTSRCSRKLSPTKSLFPSRLSSPTKPLRTNQVSPTTNSRNRRTPPKKATPSRNRRNRSRSFVPFPPDSFRDSSTDLRLDSLQLPEDVSSAGCVEETAADVPAAAQGTSVPSPAESNLIGLFLPDRPKETESEHSSPIAPSSKSMSSDGDFQSNQSHNDSIRGKITMEVRYPRKITEYELHNKLGLILGSANRSSLRIFPGFKGGTADPPLLVELPIDEARTLAVSLSRNREGLDLRPVDYHCQWLVRFVWKSGGGGGGGGGGEGGINFLKQKVEEYFRSKEGFMVWEKDIDSNPSPRILGRAYFYTKRDLSRFLDDFVDEDHECIDCKVVANEDNGFDRRSFQLDKRDPLPRSLLLRQVKTVLGQRFPSVFNVSVDRRSQSHGVVVFEYQKAAAQFERSGNVKLEIGGAKIVLTPGKRNLEIPLIQVELYDIPPQIYDRSLVGKLRHAMAAVGRQQGYFKFSGDKGIAFFFDDDHFTPNHKIFEDGFVDVRGYRVMVQLREQWDGSVSSLSPSVS